LVVDLLGHVHVHRKLPAIARVDFRAIDIRPDGVADDGGPAEIELRPLQLGDPRGIEINGRRVVGAGGEGHGLAHGAGALLVDLEARGHRGAGQ
jgi:hypothetical protein